MTLPKGATLARLAVFLGLLVAFSGAWFASREKVTMPQFAPTTSLAPQVVVEVEPDFGYRIGDLVHVTVYVKQQAATDVDLGSLALEGDFEARQDFDVVHKTSPDGARITRLKMVLQSFKYGDKLQATVSLPWQEVGNKQVNDFRAPLVTVHTSKTYDGRKAIQHGPMTIVYGWKIVTAIVCIIAGVAGIAGAWYWMRRIRLAMPAIEEPLKAASPRTIAHLRFQTIWARIEAGDTSAANFQEIACIVREFLNVEAVVSDDVKDSLGNGHPHADQIMCVLTMCDRVMYKADELKPDELSRLKAAFEQFIMLQPFAVWPSASE